MAMLPVMELRGAIPIGISWGLHPLDVFTLCVIGSTLPSPVLILSFRHILKWIKKHKHLYKIGYYIDKKLNKKGKSLKKYKILGLICFVGIPLPSTGAWSGAMAASLLKLSMKEGLIGIFIGNIMAGIIVLAISYHLI